MNDPRISSLREQYQARRAAVFDAIMAGGTSTRGIQGQLRKLSHLADGLLCDLWQWAQLPGSLSLVAVGGFGRGTLFPHSDIDVLLLLPAGTDLDNEATLRTQIEQFIGSCWDAGLEIGSSVRTIAQCITEAEADVTVQGNVGTVRSTNGNVRAGNVTGNIETRTGNVTCGHVQGGVSSRNGNVFYGGAK